MDKHISLYKEFHQLVLNGSEEYTIWRYMDFAKFVSLLANSSLFFTRSDKFEDPFEGLQTTVSLKERHNTYNESPYRKLIIDAKNEEDNNRKKHTFLNCWHLNENESYAMWKIYGKSSQSIAIRSTVKNLKRSILVPEGQKLYISKVKYGNRELEKMPEETTLFPYLFKANYFEFEKELRAILWTKDTTSIGDLHENVTGLSIKTDLEILIESVYISPATEQWFKELVRSVMDKYGLIKRIASSSLVLQ